MEITQESILSSLLAEGGKVKKSDLVDKFKGLLDCLDPVEKGRNRTLFKTFVNNVAFVKEIDGARYVVVKKMYQHLLENVQTVESPLETSGNEEIWLAGEQQRPPVRSEETERSEGAGGGRSGELDPDLASESRENPSELPFSLGLALQKTKYTDINKAKRKMNFEMVNPGTNIDNCLVKQPTTIQSKPYGLPLRMPPSATRVEVRKLKGDSHDPHDAQKMDPSKGKRKPPSVETNSSASSPQLRRSVKSTKVLDEPRDTRIPSMIPTEQSDHEWQVKCASGLWRQVHGMLLGDRQLAMKRDFISGFTVLHWAAKCGNREMLVKVIDISKEGGVYIDINARTHGGYTPLHIAALHNQEYIMAMLVAEFGANVNIRDNCGKRAYHYLHKDSSGTLREMLGGPKIQQAEDIVLHEKEELDLVPDLSKGRHTISRLFQPHVTGHKKKDKQRPVSYSMSNDPSEEREDKSSGFRLRIMSDSM